VEELRAMEEQWQAVSDEEKQARSESDGTEGGADGDYEFRLDRKECRV
jgi:hypothetical protein